MHRVELSALRCLHLVPRAIFALEKNVNSLFSNLFRGRLWSTSALIMRNELTGLAFAWGGVTFETEQPPQPSLCPVLLSWSLHPPREPGMPGRAAQSRRINSRINFSPAPGTRWQNVDMGALSTFWVWRREAAEAGSQIPQGLGPPWHWLAFALSRMVGLSRLCCLFLPATCPPCSFSRDRAPATCLKEMEGC